MMKDRGTDERRDDLTAPSVSPRVTRPSAVGFVLASINHSCIHEQALVSL